MVSRPANHPAVHALFFAAYFGLGKLGLTEASLNAHTSAIWPPSGFALAALLLFGRGYWPAIAVSACLVHFESTHDFLPAVAIGIGNTLEVFVGALLVSRFAGGEDVCHSARNIFRLTAIVAMAAAISAACASVAVVVFGESSSAEMSTIAITWWMAHFAGSLVVAPLLLLWARRPVWGVTWRQGLESVLQLTLLTGVALFVFGGRFPSDIQSYSLEFLCLPFFLWAAFRFGRRQVVISVAVLAGVAVWGTAHGVGPFKEDTLNESLVLVQAYSSVMAILGLVLAAAVADQRQAERQLQNLALTDPLTGLANYRRLIEVMRSEIARSNRTRRPFSVLFIDLDGLKRINDVHGHLVGSRALCRVAEILKASCRTIDTPARFGGDEFALVLPETPVEGGEVLLARIQARLSMDPASPRLSVSGGVAVFPDDGESPTMLLRTADEMLYRAKQQSGGADARGAGTDVGRTGAALEGPALRSRDRG